MNRGEAYAVLAAELAERRRAGFSALVAEVGRTARHRVVRMGGEDVVVETFVEWADPARTSVRVTASAAGPSWWKLERLDESIVVRPPSGTAGPGAVRP